MDSVPPAITAEAVPVMIVWAARMMALREDAQTLFMVVHTVECGMPAPRAHWRAGACPRLEDVSLKLGDRMGRFTLLREHCQRRPLQCLRV